MATWCQRNPQVFSQFLGKLRDNIAVVKEDTNSTYTHTLACETWKTVQYDDGFVKQNMNFGGSCKEHKPVQQSKCNTSSWVGAGISAGLSGLLAIAFPGVGLLVGAGIAAASAVGSGAITAWREGCFD